MSLSRAIKRCAGCGTWAVGITAFFIMVMAISFISDAEAENRTEITERERAMNAYVSLAEKKKETEAVPSTPSIETIEQLKKYEKELLRFPKKDRFRFGQDTHYTYDSNVSRLPIHHDKEDSTFKITPFAEVNLSGQKTDVRFEYRWDRTYNAKLPASDNFTQEGTLRFSRKILPKTEITLNDRLSRNSVRSAGMDNKKISWGNNHRVTLNYKYNPKLNLNLEANYTRTDFGHENFDETSNYNFSLDPNLSYSLTPKSKVTFGYRWNFSQIPTESSDATTHEIRTGYSGKLTPKSTLSADFSFNNQIPNSAQASRSRQAQGSLGYVWQATKKTSIRTLYSTSYSHSLSDSVSGSSILKTSTKSLSDSLSLSLRVRLHKKLTAEFSFKGAHAYSKTKKTGSLNTHTQTWTFPFQLAIDLDVKKWLRLRLTYTYHHQIGDERKTDENRAHTLFLGANVGI